MLRIACEPIFQMTCVLVMCLAVSRKILLWGKRGGRFYSLCVHGLYQQSFVAHLPCCCYSRKILLTCAGHVLCPNEGLHAADIL